MLIREDVSRKYLKKATHMVRTHLLWLMERNAFMQSKTICIASFDWNFIIISAGDSSETNLSKCEYCTSHDNVNACVKINDAKSLVK